MNEENHSSGEMMGDGCGDRAKIALGLGEGMMRSTLGANRATCRLKEGRSGP